MLGQQIAIGRRERRWTVAELAERVGASPPTISRIEKGDPSVGLGVAFDTASILGIPLFSGDATLRSAVEAGDRDRLALLPARVRRQRKVDDDF